MNGELKLDWSKILADDREEPITFHAPTGNALPKSLAAIELETTVMKIFEEGVTKPEAILEKLRETRGTYFEKTWGGYVPLFLERIKRIVSTG